MKKVLAMVLALLMLCGCGSSENGSADISDTEINDSESSNTEISESESTEITNTTAVVMVAEIVGENEISVILTNNSNWVVGYGQPYSIQVEENGVWRFLAPKEEVFFTMEIRHLDPGQSSSWNLNLSHIYGDLPEGNYRIVKGVSIYKKANDFGSSENMTLAAEFKI